MSTHRTRRQVLRVDPIACQAHGLCAQMLPEAIGLDEWGYPLLTAHPISDDLLPDAQAAVATCPTLALRLVPEPSRNT